MKLIKCTIALLLISNLVQAQQSYFDVDKKYNSDSLRIWTKELMDKISEKHPGMYRYTSKEKFNKIIDSTNHTIKDSLTELEYYRKLKPLFAKIGCVHTGISLSKEYMDYLNQTETLLPLDAFVDLKNRKILVSKNYETSQNLPAGGEIVAINGKPVSEIFSTLIDAVPMDGYNQTGKALLLSRRFPFWYQSMIEVSNQFNVEIKFDNAVKTYILKGVSAKTFPTVSELEDANTNALDFEIKNGIGYLSIHSFAKTFIKNHRQNFKKFIQETFKTIKEKEVKNLIIDLRDNTGGTDGNAVYLASYFFNKPFRYWDKVEVTEATAKEIKGINSLFFKKPTKEITQLYQWKKSWYTHEFDYYETQNPNKNSFHGTAYIITNGMCLSSCSDFVAILSDNRKAVVVGQESGGGFQGNTSGMMPQTKIKTGLIITIPLQLYTNAVDLNRNFGHGTIPDVEIRPDFENWISNKDVEMEETIRLIKQ